MYIQERFIKACSEGKLEKVRKMLNNKILAFFKLNIDRKGNSGNTPLLAAIKGDHNLTVKYLIDSGADVNKGTYNYTPLDQAIESGNIEIVRLLIDSGADVNSDSGSALHAAIGKQHIEIVKLLIEAGADVNKERYNKTPLMVSCQKVNLEIILLLIISGAKIDTKDSHGETALMFAGNNCDSYDQFRNVAKIFFFIFKDGDKIPDSEIKKLWEQINDYYERKRIMLSRVYSQQREATSKGSIGHDSLNVKTLKRTEWEEQILILNQNIEKQKEKYLQV